MEDVIPVDVLEEWVPLDFLRIRLARTESPQWVASQQLEKPVIHHIFERGSPLTYLLQDRDSVAWHGDRVERLILKNGVENFVFVVTAER